MLAMNRGNGLICLRQAKDDDWRNPLGRSPSAIAALQFPGTAPIKASPTSGLRTDSVALVFQLRAIDRGRIKEKVGTVSESELVEIRLELAKLLGS